MCSTPLIPVLHFCCVCKWTQDQFFFSTPLIDQKNIRHRLLFVKLSVQWCRRAETASEYWFKQTHRYCLSCKYRMSGVKQLDLQMCSLLCLLLLNLYLHWAVRVMLGLQVLTRDRRGRRVSPWKQRSLYEWHSGIQTANICCFNAVLCVCVCVCVCVRVCVCV